MHLGYVSDGELVTLYKRARALVMPTFFGPTNIPPLEAFSLGCPVAISDVRGITEQVGDAAVTFDPEDVDSIADAIERLWLDDDLCRRLVSKGRHRIQSWTPEQFSSRLSEILLRCAMRS